MCEILEEDLGLRTEAALEAIQAGADPMVEFQKIAKEALIARYLDGMGGGRGGRRRIVSAILADGSQKVMREFGEVWKNETKERKAKKDEEALMWDRSKKLDLENDQWGDYGMNGDEDEDTEETGANEMAEGSESNERDELDFGGIESMKLRQRLMSLVRIIAA
jgi:hypothetical protein